jgi:hypothetical protein
MREVNAIRLKKRWKYLSVFALEFSGVSCGGGNCETEGGRGKINF